MRAVLALAIAALVFAAPASAGGIATAGLGPPDDGIGAGDTWKAEVTILQHGVTPVVGATPKVIIVNTSGVRREFTARPTDKPGVYLANVEFPSAGTWRYMVYDGFTEYGHAQTHTFASVRIGPAGGGSERSVPTWTIAVAAAAAMLVIAFLLARRLRPAAAPATH